MKPWMPDAFLATALSACAVYADAKGWSFASGFYGGVAACFAFDALQEWRFWR